MSPELLVPSTFGFIESTPTPQADIYAFGVVIYQARDHDRGYPPLTYISQVLTGKLPYPGLGMTEITLNVVQGVRPRKPEDASAIGFSDPLWSFIQRCWDGKMEPRPKVAEVVSQLERAASNWDGVMPPCAQAEDTTSTLFEPESDSPAHRKLQILILRFFSLNYGTGGIFLGSSSSVVSDPESDSLPFSEQLAIGVGGVVAKDDRNTQNPMQPRKEQPCDDIPVLPPHLEQRYESPPSKLPVTRKRAERLNSFLISMFKPSGKTQTGVTSRPPLNQPGMYDHLKSSNDPNQYLSGDAGGIFQSANKPVLSPDPLPLSLAEMIVELRKRPDQDLIDTADGVCSSAF